MTVIPHLHASCVEKDGIGILIRGHSGAGKSSFALSLLNHGFRLVADDQVRTVVENGALIAEPADNLKGLLEVRGVGILQMNYSPRCTLRYLVDLVPGYVPERLPKSRQKYLSGVPLQIFQMDSRDPKSIEKILVLFHQDFLGIYEENQNGEITSKSC